jgi:4-hydroxy-tetrahydrodipicolinate synthase
MVYSNRIACRVDVINEMLMELLDDSRFVEVKESSGDLTRTTEAVASLGGRLAVFTGVDNLAFEALWSSPGSVDSYWLADSSRTWALLS